MAGREKLKAGIESDFDALGGDFGTGAPGATVREFLAQAAARGVEMLDASLILTEVLHLPDRSALAGHPERLLTPSELAIALALLDRRAQGWPLAYLLGYRDFYGRRFAVTPDVLIPRPETEELIEVALGVLQREGAPRERGVTLQLGATLRRGVTLQRGEALRQGNDTSGGGRRGRIYDIGTGSGAIAITLDLETRHRYQITGVDISPVALAVAHQNAAALGAQVELVAGDLLTGVEVAAPALVVANLPYVDQGWYFLSPELKYEPATALYAEKGGLAQIFRLIDQLRERLGRNTTPVASALTPVDKKSAPMDRNSTPVTEPATPVSEASAVASSDKSYLLLEADPCQHAEITAYATAAGFTHLLTAGYALLFAL